MGGVKMLALLGATALLSTAAQAADFPPAMPPVPQYVQPPPPVESGWYLRGFLGMSNQQFKSLTHPSFVTAPQFTFIDAGGFDSGPFFGGGFGFQWNSWFRFDVTAETRGKVGFHALDRFFNTGMDAFNTNQYTASKSEIVVLGNAFVDLGSWWCITPFIGAGAGFTRNKIEHFRDVNVIAGGGGWADTGTQINFAWALYAGAAYKTTSGLAIELSYRYLNLGNAVTDTLRNLDPTFVSGNQLAPITFNNISSHDFMLGVRWMLQQDTPQPVYAPPLMRRG